LLVAASSGNPELVKALIGAGAKVDLRRHGAWDGDTPLYIAASRGHSAVVQVLVEAGANVNVRRGALGTDVHVLFWASSNGDVGTVAQLLVNGATVERRDLFAAIAGGHVEVVHRLLQAGADPRWSSQEFRDVLEAAEHSPEPTRQKMIAAVALFLPRSAAGRRGGR
jgi:ankyrin repeat protein